MLLATGGLHEPAVSQLTHSPCRIVFQDRQITSTMHNRLSGITTLCCLLALCIFPRLNAQAISAPADREFRHLRIYQVMVEAYRDGDPERNYGTGYGNSSHRGDLRGIIQALPYIRSLGMNALWLTPIFDSGAGQGPDPRLEATGYFPKDYFKIDPKFGTFEDARELVDTAHALGMYVLFDGVFGHHKGDVVPSPRGHVPAGDPAQVSWPESLPFYKEVATYWIDTLGIDGWRLDQAYQIPIPMLRELREAIRSAAEKRRRAGEQWGTLGYVVGEVWKRAPNIARYAYGTADEPGLLSAFDFPLRYKLVQVLAVEEKGFGHQPASVLEQGYRTHALYPAHAVPNLMLGNHDLVRFGDLIQRAGYAGPESETYWRRHRCALAFLAAFSGPITLYYGEEYGDEIAGFSTAVSAQDGCVQKGLCDDHVARNDGKISGFTEQQKALQNFVRRLFALRAAHPALWRGERRNLLATQHLYLDLKYAGTDSILFAMNTGPATEYLRLAQFNGLRQKFRDAFSGELFDPADERMIELPGLSVKFLIAEPANDE